MNPITPNPHETTPDTVPIRPAQPTPPGDPHPTVRLSQPTGVFLNDAPAPRPFPPQPPHAMPVALAPAPVKKGLPPAVLGGVLLLGIAMAGLTLRRAPDAAPTPAATTSATAATSPGGKAGAFSGDGKPSGKVGAFSGGGKAGEPEAGSEGEETGALAGNVTEGDEESDEEHSTEKEGDDKDVGTGEWAHGKPRLMIPGEFSVFDTKNLPRDGEEWLGLFRSGDQFALKAATVRVQVVPQPGLGAATEEDLRKDRNGRKVWVDGQGEGVTVPVMLRGLRGLPVGPVKTSWARPNMNGWVHAQDNEPDEAQAAEKKPEEAADSQGWLAPGQRMEWSLGEQNVTLRWDSPAPKGKEEEGGEMAPGTRLKLEQGGSGQTLLLSGKNIRILGARPMWTGDLDGDGSLDLILECQEYRGDQAVEVYQAWLSSFAEPGEQVGKAAEFVEEICCI